MWIATLGFLPLCAQIPNVTDVTATPLPGTGHDYIRLLDETVNPASGSVSLRIQIPIPPGRGLSLPLSIDYDSSGAHFLSSIKPGAVAWNSNDGGTSFAGRGGWRYGLPILTLSVQSNVWMSPSYVRYVCDFTTDYLFQDTRAGRHPLYLSIMGPANNAPSDSCLQSSTGVWDQPPPRPPDGTSGFGRDGQFQGSTTVPSDTEVLSSLPVTTVFDPDGNLYHYTATGIGSTIGGVVELPDWVRDRNGNRVTFQSLNAGYSTSGGAFSITDTLQRTITFSGFANDGDTITVPGYASPYTLHWTSLASNYDAPVSNWHDPNGLCTQIQSNVIYTSTAVSSIVLPNGQQYQFGYDPKYDLLNKITYPSGATVTYTWTRRGWSRKI